MSDSKLNENYEDLQLVCEPHLDSQQIKTWFKNHTRLSTQVGDRRELNGQTTLSLQGGRWENRGDDGHVHESTKEPFVNERVTTNTGGEPPQKRRCTLHVMSGIARTTVVSRQGRGRQCDRT